MGERGGEGKGEEGEGRRGRREERGDLLQGLIRGIDDPGYVDDLNACFSFGQKPLLIIYADDIILTAPSVGLLQKLLYKCEQELCWLRVSLSV